MALYPLTCAAQRRWYQGAFVRLAPGTQRLLSSGVFAATLIAFLRYALVIARG